MVPSTSSFLCWLVSPALCAQEGRTSVVSLASRCPRPPSIAVCPSFRKSWPNSWMLSRHEPSRRCSRPSLESPCPHSRWDRLLRPPRASPTCEGERSKHPPSSLFSFFQTQDYDTWLQEFKEKTVGALKQQMITTEPSVSEGWELEGRGSAGGSHVSSPHRFLPPFPLLLGFSS